MSTVQTSLQSRVLANAARGASDGVIATAAMSAVMELGRRMGLLPEHPPKHVMRAGLPGHKRRPKKYESPLAILAHFAFGAGLGGLFSMAAGKRRVPVSLGVGYGVAIWIAGYQAGLPALDILPPISEDRPGRPLVMGLGHVVFGACLAILHNDQVRGQRLVPRLEEEAEPRPVPVHLGAGIG
ncbi:hypothetical protein [Sinosporangium siamense]|uniref:DUF1440 domain-containing protein n=1 Tax=Sinosporangium siamense TaxID=1367973 RepID=A0A919RLL5_9ACTN|nr:hypothetical protein [Sinosporangium siamense]GII96028.1 hypothetical protein Ssi02_62590 [Sinosporangium siamense]